MSRNKIALKFFSSGLQAIAVQVLGSIFFYIISICLSKDDFGIISWMNAVSVFITTFLGFGLEQVVIRRIAASERSDWAAAAFFAHSVISFLVTLLLLTALNFFSRNEAENYKLLPWFFMIQGLTYIGTPLKQFLNAKEQFTPYGIIAVISNIFKITAACLLFYEYKLSIRLVIIILGCAGGFELCCLLLYILRKTTFSFRLHLKAYLKLLKESSAPYISVIFDMSLSRTDWILLGVMTTNAILADYSFAYRAYELSRLPVMIIAPIILPRLARFMSAGNKPDIAFQRHINSFFTIEMFFAVLIPLSVNILWTPLLTFITKGKYGETNSLQFLMLSLCIPLQFFINLLWSLSFGAKKYKSVSFITIVCAASNILLNLVLISESGGLGAAAAFLITMLLQAYLYYKLVYRQIMIICLRPLLLFIAEALIIYLSVIRLPIHFLLQLLIAVVLYLLTAILSKQVSRQHFDEFKLFLSR